VRKGHGGLDAAVPEELLDLADTDPTHQQMGGEAVT
jgi:hypothetical protein